MTVGGAWREGLRRVRRAPSLVVLMWALTVVVTIPPAIALADAVEAHLGSSIEAESAADGVNYDWLQEFRAAAGPLGRSLRPEVIGFAATLDNMDAMSNATARSAVVALAAASYVILLWFLSAGIISRLAENGPLYADGFGAACGGFAGRLLRLGVIAALLYLVVFGAIHQALLENLFDRITADMTVERNAFVVRLMLYALFFLIVGAVNLLVELARIRLIVEHRYSVVGAFIAAAGFVRSQPRLAFGIYIVDVAAYAAIVVLYGIVAPGAGAAGWQMWTGFALGQLYVVARLAVKLTFWGAGVAAVQSRLGWAPATEPRPAAVTDGWRSETPESWHTPSSAPPA
jgi:hypothetical protein